jgi:CubicO group peptidase (beta-lactamase class C family)
MLNAPTLITSAWSLIVLAAIPFNPPARADDFDKVRTLIKEQLAETRTASIAVAAVRDGKIVWEEGFGWADVDNRVAADAHTRYSLASVSKAVTATGLMVLVRKGKVDLDRPINDYLGESKVTARAGSANNATVRRVANHTAGLPVHHQFFYDNEPDKPPAMDDTITRYAYLTIPPGERFLYSNLGYGILGHVIARASGQEFGTFLRAEVFEPLGLDDMSLGVRPHDKTEARRYDEAQKLLPRMTSDHPGASDVFGSAHDLARFALFHLKAHLKDQRAILSDEQIDELQSGKPWQGMGYLIEETTGGYRLICYPGGMPGVRADVILAPAKRVAVVVLSNSRSRAVNIVSKAMLSVLIPDLGGRASKPAPGDKVDIKTLTGTWVGTVHTYQAEIPFRLVVTDSGEARATLGKEPECPVTNGRIDPEGFLTGQLRGDLGTEDLKRHRYVLVPHLKRNGDVLSGSLIAWSDDGRRERFELPHWVELKREGKGQP